MAKTTRGPSRQETTSRFGPSLRMGGDVKDVALGGREGVNASSVIQMSPCASVVSRLALGIFLCPRAGFFQDVHVVSVGFFFSNKLFFPTTLLI